MIIFPAIDIYEGKAVRLYKGDYNQKTVYSDNPVEIGIDFKNSGATWIHIVDLEGAKTGMTPNLDLIVNIKKETSLFIEVGGGIRNMDTVSKYLDSGIDRVILGTAAVKDEEFLKEAIDKYHEKIAVGIDIKDNNVAIKGWTEDSGINAFDFFSKMQTLGVKTIICTDISKDGAMLGTNRQLYKSLSEKFSMQIIASGGVSTIDDVKALNDMNIYGAIIGKAYYIKAINLKEAIEVTNAN